MLRRVSLAALVLLIIPFALQAQQPGQTPNPQPKDERSMSRDERIKAHQERIERIIKENREKQEQEAKRLAEKAKANATPAPGAGPAVTPQPGQPLPAGPVTQYTPAPGQGQAAPPPAAPAAPVAARSESRSLLYVKPFDTVVNVGETFSTDIVADTKNGAADAISLRIRYPKGILNPLALDLSSIESMIDGDLEYGNDADQGLLFVRVQMLTPSKFPDKPVIQIVWEALAPTGGAGIELEFGKKQTTGLFYDGVNVLGTTGTDGVINGTVMVRNPKARTLVQKIGDKDLLIASTRYEEPKKSMSLGLESSVQSVRQGEVFDVNLVLSNVDNAPFDRFRAYIQFDPKDLEVTDSDRGNWIRRDININDGFAHERFPFDFHRQNLADNKNGFILYEEASEVKPITGSGTVARIKFRAKREILNTEILLVANGSEVSPNTDVNFMGQTTLVNRPSRLSALSILSISVNRRTLALQQR